MTDLQLEKKRKLRKNQTKAEAIIWQCLRNRNFLNLKFRRQYSVGVYVVDFYCPSLRLAIEIDGDSHFTEQAKIYDKHREEYIKQFNIKFIRFTNDDVFNNLEGVLKHLTLTLS